jgi:hypothetical protein
VRNEFRVPAAGVLLLRCMRSAVGYPSTADNAQGDRGPVLAQEGKRFPGPGPGCGLGAGEHRHRGVRGWARAVSASWAAQAVQLGGWFCWASLGRLFPLSRAHEWAEVQRQEKVGLRPKMNIKKHVSVYCFSEAVLKEFCIVFHLYSI